MADEQMTPEQAAALANYLGIGANINLSGTRQIDAVENLAGLSDNLLAQALLGYLTAEDIGVIVQGLMYEPYEGQDPLVAQQEINVALRAVGETLGLAPETLNQLALSVAGGTPTDVALATISGSIFRDEEGLPLVDVSQADAKDFDLLGSLLSEYGKAARLEDTLVDFGGQKYSKRSDADVRKDMADLGLTGEFADPDLWVAQLPQDRLDRSAEAATMAADERRQMDTIRRLSDLGSEVYKAQSYDPTNIFEQFARESARRASDRAMAEEEAERLANSRSGGRIINIIPPESRSGGRKINIIPNQTRIVIRDDQGQPEEPFRRIVVEGTDDAKRNLQTEQAIKSAQRYAMFSALENAENNRRLNEARANEIAAPQLLPMGGVQTRQDSLDAVALSNALQAQDEAVIPGAQSIDAFRDFITSSLPTQTKQGSGRPARISLADDVIRNAARSAAAPYLRSR